MNGIMESEKNEKQDARMETGVLIPPEKAGVQTCPENECICRALKHNFELTRMIFGSVLFTAHVAALIFLVVTFGGGKVRDDKILNLQLELEAIRFECDSSLRSIRYKLRNIENLIDNKLNLEKQESSEKLPDLDVFERHDTSTEQNDNSHFPKPASLNFFNRINMTDGTVHPVTGLPETFENATRVVQNGTTDPDDSELPLDGKLCTKLLSSDVEDLMEYSRLCGELDVHNRRTKRSNLRGPVASHFKGGVPETFIRDGGLVAPWYPDNKASSIFTLKYEFREGQGTVEVTEEGLYLIYAQVYYLTTEPLNTYVINVREKDAQTKPIAYCSSNAVIPVGGVSEVSCYTAAIRYLNATNQVFISQRDRNRRVILRDGHSFLGLVCLNSVPERKRRGNNRN